MDRSFLNRRALGLSAGAAALSYLSSAARASGHIILHCGIDTVSCPFSFGPWPAALHWQEKAVKIPTPQGDLSGTVTLPADTSDMPAVLIVPGSGPTDRDGNDARYGLRTDLYRLIAQGLAENGIASLRYDKRGVGASASNDAIQVPLVLETYVQDVVHALQATENIPNVSGVFLLGHSEGGLMSILAAHQTHPRGLILLESQGRSLQEILREQLRAAAVPADLRARADRIMDDLTHDRPVTDVPPGLAPLFGPGVQAYMRSILAVDPGHEIESLHLPTLIIQGTADLQTSMRDATHLHDGDPGADVLQLSGTNHILRDVPADRDANLASYGKPELPLDPRLLPALVSFVRARAS